MFIAYKYLKHNRKKGNYLKLIKKRYTTLILVGGLGTRLQKVVKDYPKPMAMISNKPFLEYIIMQMNGPAASRRAIH